MMDINHKYVFGAIILSIVVAMIFIFGFTNSDIVDGIDESIGFFNDSYIHEIRLYFDDADWFDNLYENHMIEDDPYSSATLYHEKYGFYTVGVRFKGASSFSYPSNKKSFKIDVNEFFESCNIYDDLPECKDLSFYGLRKINLNNGFKDPSFMREKIFLGIASNYLPTIRAVFVNVYINDEYMGLYTGVEQPEDTFIEMNYGEVGNLFECERTESQGKGQSSFGSDLGYISEEISDYYEYYELKTTEKENSWEGLLHFIDVLNNYNDEDFVKEIEKIADVDEFLTMLALNNLFGNYDSYTGSSHNYYVYEDTKGIFHPIFWDTNEAFGVFGQGAPASQSEADIFYGNHILEERFFSIPNYRARYLEIVEDIATS